MLSSQTNVAPGSASDGAPRSRTSLLQSRRSSLASSAAEALGSSAAAPRSAASLGAFGALGLPPRRGERPGDTSLRGCRVVLNTTKGDLLVQGDTFFRKLGGLLRLLELDVAQVSRETDEAFDISEIGAKSVLVLVAPSQKFSTNEFIALKQYLARGGSILYLATAGGESARPTNVNYLLEELGISVNADTVVRTAFEKYHHPAEVLIGPAGVLNRALHRAAGRPAGAGGLSFVYPRGASLNVQTPAFPILGSGYLSLPVSRPIGAVHESRQGGERVCVLGSAEMASDAYLGCEDNADLLKVLLRWCLTGFALDPIDAREPDITDYQYVPNIPLLAETPKASLQESDRLPANPLALLSTHAPALFALDTALVPRALDLYRELRLPHGRLELIEPPFETPLPPLEPAMFAPRLVDLPAPQLELFDLDATFASEKVRLAQVTNKCNDGDLEYYIRECAAILGVTDRLMGKGDAAAPTARQLLHHVASQVFAWKMPSGGHADYRGTPAQR